MSSEAIHSATCPLCEDTGWKTSSVKRGVRTVSRCDCRMAARNAGPLAKAEIPAQYEHCTLDDFDVAFPGAATESLSKALLSSRKFVEEFPLEKAGILL